MFAQIANGLAYAHKNGVVHCDIKPENILIDFEGVVRILDFGIAKLFSQGDESNNEAVQQEEYVFGSPNYMAPEQNVSLAHTTAKSDIYSLGVIMYFYFCHALPIAGCPPPNRVNISVTQPLSDLIMACLCHTPEDRPDSAEAVRTRLLRILNGQHIADTQKRRANAGVKAALNLLDVIKESEFSSVYLFEKAAQSASALFVLKKKPVNSNGQLEAKKLATLKHGNIVSVLGTSSNARTFIIVMEYCRGGSLADKLIRRYDLPSFYDVAIKVVAGLAHAHQHAIVHGNLRPTNILFDANGTPKLADFGQEEHYQHSNENWYSHPAQPASKRGDVFSCGVMFYQMLTGELPKWKKAKLAPCSVFKKTPKELQVLLMNMLTDSDELDDIQRVEARLQAFVGEQNTVARPISLGLPAKSYKHWLLMAGLAGIVLIGLGVFGFYRGVN